MLPAPFQNFFILSLQNRLVEDRAPTHPYDVDRTFNNKPEAPETAGASGERKTGEDQQTGVTLFCLFRIGRLGINDFGWNELVILQ